MLKTSQSSKVTTRFCRCYHFVPSGKWVAEFMEYERLKTAKAWDYFASLYKPYKPYERLRFLSASALPPIIMHLSSEGSDSSDEESYGYGPSIPLVFLLATVKEWNKKQNDEENGPVADTEYEYAIAEVVAENYRKEEDPSETRESSHEPRSKTALLPAMHQRISFPAVLSVPIPQIKLPLVYLISPEKLPDYSRPICLVAVPKSREDKNPSGIPLTIRRRWAKKTHKLKRLKRTQRFHKVQPPIFNLAPSLRSTTTNPVKTPMTPRTETRLKEDLGPPLGLSPRPGTPTTGTNTRRHSNSPLPYRIPLIGIPRRTSHPVPDSDPQANPSNSNPLDGMDSIRLPKMPARAPKKGSGKGRMDPLFKRSDTVTSPPTKTPTQKNGSGKHSMEPLRRSDTSPVVPIARTLFETTPTETGNQNRAQFNVGQFFSKTFPNLPRIADHGIEVSITAFRKRYQSTSEDNGTSCTRKMSELVYAIKKYLEKNIPGSNIAYKRDDTWYINNAFLDALVEERNERPAPSPMKFFSPDKSSPGS